MKITPWTYTGTVQFTAPGGGDVHFFIRIRTMKRGGIKLLAVSGGKGGWTGLKKTIRIK